MTWNAAKLKAFREEHGLTQSALAERLRANRFTIVNWERGGSIPPMACAHLDLLEQQLNREKLDREPVPA